ncbi:hypothetical protein BD779DRAFT_761449 [Infundibulicybe gibba]|nr:hypothetical protein BD779DRAFT_761449 [Infundibulicybe gibba]
MHRCLLIQEILQMICSHVGTFPLAHCNLLAMALVCHHFFNAPMDRLWHKVPDLFYVLRCLPSNVWKAPLTYYRIESAVLARAIAPIDLECFRTLYAHRVQVSQRSIVQPEVPANVYQALSFAFQGQPIFPNLVELGQTGPGGSPIISVCFLDHAFAR